MSCSGFLIQRLGLRLREETTSDMYERMLLCFTGIELCFRGMYFKDKKIILMQ